ncbi:MAG TPA: pyridoxal phosphate-dependent aminotransferase [Candidatus Saccharimonadales bacterium]|nr:pyridoxal phosphate-dependent aminotransferase [Candidatus Saccharimonadales bacterium]
MRNNIVHPGAGELHYEIRGIVEFAQSLAATGLDITWENIGDPVVKGETIPDWIREIIADEVLRNTESYAYSPTKGLQSAREFIAADRSRQGTQLEADNILFFNGLGDAINKIYTWLNPKSRVLGPNPAYPTHSAVEAAHGRSAHITYKLDPNNKWLPNINDIRTQVAEHPEVAGLLIINPDNPTGMVYPKSVLEELIDIAREYKLFLIADEIYANLTFRQSDFMSLASTSSDVPMMVMRGLSKEVPWPGGRCGWLEFYGLELDKDFARYAKSIEDAKMTEVSSTTLPQTVMPAILGDPRFPKHLASRRQKYARRAAEAVKILNSSKNLNVVSPKGAFYLAVTFEGPKLASKKLPGAANFEAQMLLDNILADLPAAEFDKRFCHQLMAATGICVVPLSTGFNSAVHGFRMTLLEADDAKFTNTLQNIIEFCG